MAIPFRWFLATSLVTALAGVPCRSLALMASEMAFRAVVGECPTSSPGQRSSENRACPTTQSAKPPSEYLKSDLGRVSDLAYLTSLARMRAQELGCAESQVSDLGASQTNATRFVDDFAEKIKALGYSHRRLAKLQLMLEQKTPRAPGEEAAVDPTTREFTQEKRNFDLIMASVPFNQFQSVQVQVRALIQQERLFPDSGARPAVGDYLKSSAAAMLGRLKGEIGSNKTPMDEAVRSFSSTLDTKGRESLAQDIDLIERFKGSHPEFGTQLAPVMCRVDARYGRGAVYRDRALFAASLVATGGYLSLESLGAVLIGRGLVASGIPRTTANIMRAMATTVDTVAAGSSLQRAVDACWKEVSTLSSAAQAAQGTAPATPRCPDLLKSTQWNSCLLAAYFTGMNAWTGVSMARDVTGALRARPPVPNGRGSTAADK